ncbi:MAG: hypothetical protein EOO92_10295 [Pedobacter sp.]|nr:MAG: hypothetical protein EOO92_10295 [Pedobacter sp.]
MKRRTFHSKIGLSLLLPIISVLSIVTALTILNEVNWVGLIILGATTAFVVHLLLTTRYTIIGDQVNIECGFLYNQTLDIHSIIKLTETNNPLSSPATSLDRIAIYYGSYDQVLISPKDKEGFIREILNVNPDVTVEVKGSLKESV